MSEPFLQELQTTKKRLVRMRNLYQTVLPIAYGITIIFPIVAFLVVPLTDLGESFRNLLLLYSGMAIVPVLSFRTRLRQIEADLQECDFSIDLQNFDVSSRERRAEKILRLNDFQLRRYYDLNLSDNRWIFGLGATCILLGAAIIGITLYLVINVAVMPQVKVITAVLGGVGAILSNFVAVIYLRMNTAATANLASFHGRLVGTHKFLLGNLLVSRIENEAKRDDALAQLSSQLMQQETPSVQQQQQTP